MECPFVDRSIEWDGAHLEAVAHPLGDGSAYRFYRFYRLYPGQAAETNCQFCVHIGRKYDVFECLNEWQWVKCSHFRANLAQLPDDFSLDDVPALI